MASTGDALEEFFANCSIHGLKHIAKKSGNHWTERLFWALCCALSGWGSVLLVLSSYETLRTNPLSSVVSTSYLDWSINFPSVSVCEVENNNKSKILAREYFGEFYDLNKMGAMHDIAFFRDATPYLKKTCQKKKSVFNCSGIDVQSTARAIRSSCEETFDHCRWNGEEFNCCDHFLHLETELGVCYSINNLQTKNRSDPETFIDLKSNRSTGPGILRLDLKTTAKVYIHSRTDVPNLNTEQTDVIALESKPKSQDEVFLVVHDTENEEGVRHVGAERRKCNFPWEGRPEYYPQYSYSACIVECRRRTEMALCNCTRHLLPPAGKTGKACDINNIFCIKDNEYWLLTLGPPWTTNSNALKCPCRSGCEDIQIDAIQSRSHENPNARDSTKSSVEMNLLYLPSEKYKRTVVRSRLDLVVSMGSAFALFFGASLLSFVEIVYYCTLRLRRRQPNQKKSLPTPEGRKHQRIITSVVQNSF
ncbi:sodium channel protein Nach-like [Zootermopsis nevadensis]|uniref:sodium channel protein Nach-like n=1 Tax=Zootermopsis nevadensis TaxID=136037 RepID=UPI000B8E5624|nr:sodium channel protein Nach-like [Zootermopsis nevadensis]